MKRNIHSIWASILVVLLIFTLPGAVQAQSGSSFPLYPGGNDSDGVSAGQSTYNVFFDQTYAYSYFGGSVCLSSQGDHCTPPAIDDYIIIWVNGNKVVDQTSYTRDFGPVDFTPFLQTGDNQIRVQLIDLMGPTMGGSALYLVIQYGIGYASQPAPQFSRPSKQDSTIQCPDIVYRQEGLPGPQSPLALVRGNVLRESPSYSAKIIKVVQEDIYDAPYVDGPVCSTPNLSQGCVNFDDYDIEIWFKVNVDGVVGWHGLCDPGTTLTDSGQNATQAQPTQIPRATQVAALPSDSISETWFTSVSECEVNPLIYEFYKDQDNQLRLVLASATGIVDTIKNFFDWLGFLIDSSKVRFEPTADEVKVTLLYSNSGKYKAKVDRYLKGKLLSSDVYNLDASTYQKYLNNLESCGINT